MTERRKPTILPKKEVVQGIYLTEAELKFCEEYLLSGDLKVAFTSAFPERAYRTVHGETKLREPNINAYLNHVREKAVTKMSLRAADVERMFLETYQAALDKGDLANANRAAENLGKWKKMFEPSAKKVEHHLMVDEETLQYDIPRLIELTGYNKARGVRTPQETVDGGREAVEVEFSEVSPVHSSTDTS